MAPLTVAATIANLSLSGTILILSIFLWNYLRSPLKAFPGPVATNFTNLWRFGDVLKGRADITLLNLHREYGAAVYVGPNTLSLSDPRVIGVVYSTRKVWRKVCWWSYSISDLLLSHVQNSLAKNGTE